MSHAYINRSQKAHAQDDGQALKNRQRKAGGIIQMPSSQIMELAKGPMEVPTTRPLNETQNPWDWNVEKKEKGKMALVTYPDGTKRPEPKIIGKYDVAYSTSYVIKQGKKVYYSKDYKYLIKKPLTPLFDMHRDVGGQSTTAYEAGYQNAMKGGSKHLYGKNQFLSMVEDFNARNWGYYWIEGYKRGVYDRKNNYEDYTRFKYKKSIETP